MNSTASPRPSVALGQATKFLRVLEDGGLTADDIQRVIDDPAFRRKVLEAFGHVAKFVPDINLSGDFSQEGVDRLIDQLSVPSRTKAIRPPDTNQYDKYRSSDVLKRLLVGLTPLQLHVISLSFGLKDDVVLEATEVAQKLEIAVRSVHYQRGTAMSAMKRVAHQIGVEERRAFEAANPALPVTIPDDAPIEDLFLDILMFNALKRRGIHDVASLTRLSAEDLFSDWGCDESMIRRLEDNLRAHSRKLND